MAPDRLASAPHPPANRGGAVGGAAAASPEPPGLRRPKASHPPAGRPDHEQHRQRFHSLELGKNGRPFMMAHQLWDACRRWLLAGEGGVEQIIDCVVLEQFMGPVPPPGIAGPGHPTRRGPDGGVPRGWRNPTIRLSLSLPSPSFSPYLPA